MALLRGCTKLIKPWQPQIVEADGQVGLGDVPQVVPYPRSRAADCECLSPWHGSLLTAMIDSGKVSRVSEKAVIEGSQLLFYIGEWTSDGERVRGLFDVRSEADLSQITLGRLRDQSPDSQKASATTL